MVNQQELIRSVESVAGENATPREVLDAASQEAHAMLWRGESVELMGLVRVQLTKEALAGKTQGAVLQAAPLQRLLRRPAKPKAAPKTEYVVLLAVEKADRFSNMTAKRLSRPGRKALVAEGMTGVMAAVKEHGVDMVIMDSDLEAGDEIRQWLKSAPGRSLISLVVVYREGENVDMVDRFRICEDEFINEPYEMEELESIITGELARIEEERKYFLHEVSFQFPTDPVYQSQAADFMETLISHTAMSEEGQMGLIVAFREAMDNAARHGNSGNKAAAVNVAYVLDREKITVTVEDEGPGFDTSMYLERQVSGDAVSVARQRHKEGRQGGLGIMLMLKSLDRLEYNRSGNVAKLTKYIASKAAVA